MQKRLRRHNVCMDGTAQKEEDAFALTLKDNYGRAT